MRQHAGEPADVHAALDPAADVQETPPRHPVHVLLSQARQPGQMLQGVFHLLQRLGFGGQRFAIAQVGLQFQQQGPEVRRQSLAHARRRAFGRAHQPDHRAPGRLVVQAGAGGVEDAAGLGMLAQGAPFHQQLAQGVKGFAGSVDRRFRRHQAGAEAADQPQRRLGAFDVPAQPEQVVRRAAGQVAQDAAHLHIFAAGDQRHPLHGFVVKDPDIGGARAFAHGNGADVGAIRHPAEAAGQDLDAVRRERGEHPQHEGRWLQLAVAQHRHGREPHHLLADEVTRPVRKPAQKPCPLVRRHVGDQLRAGKLAPRPGDVEGRRDDQVVEARRHPFAFARLSAPPRRLVGQHQILA